MGDPARNGEVSFIGDTRRGGDRSDDISSHYFHVSRNLWDDKNSITRDLSIALGSELSDDEFELFDEEFCAFFDGKDERWFNVRVDGPSFLRWLRRRIGLPDEVLVSEVNPADNEDVWYLPEDDPQPKKQGIQNFRPAITCKALRQKFRSGIIPKRLSIEALVRIAKEHSPTPKYINRDSVRRVRGKK
jgi:hypothetical protein